MKAEDASDDTAEIVDDEGDYSTPASKSTWFMNMLAVTVCLQVKLFHSWIFFVDLTSPLAKDYELQRKDIHLEAIIGEGQFGDVYKGTFKPNVGQQIPVAIKTCKIESEGEKFLEEACKFHKVSKYLDAMAQVIKP